MKKSIFSVLILVVALGVLALVYLKRSATLAESKASALVPADTVMLLEVSDLQRSRTRWVETALYKIIHEPEVQAFLEKPKSKIPSNPQFEEKWDGAQKIDAKEIFFAVTTITGQVPKFVGGFDYRGGQSDAEMFVSGLKTELKSKFPAGKSDIVKYGSSEIETFDFNDMVVASVFKDRWFFVSDDIDLLKSTLDRLDGKADEKTSLRENAAYKASMLKMPRSADVSWFVQPQTIVERFGSELALSLPNFDAKQLEAWKKIQGVSGAMKLDGEKIRDALYIFEPGRGAKPPMARNSLALTTPDTLVYYAAALDLSGPPKLPDPSLDSTGILRAIDVLRQALEGAGITYADFKEAFGPECGAMLGWPASAMEPSPILVLDVRDKTKAQKFVDTMLGGQAGFPAWAKQDIAGAHFYSLPQQATGFVPITPVMALTDKSLLFGLNLDSVQGAVKQGGAKGATMEKSPAFQAAVGTVGKPSKAFAYIDSKTLFEKVYGLASTSLKMMAMFNPHVNDYADMGKLPSTEAISKHLSPIVYSQSTDADGILMESAGPVTFSQTAFVVGVGAGAAMVPNMMKQFNQNAGASVPVPFSTPPLPVPTATP